MAAILADRGSCAMPSLVWNMMISMSTSWFFVVASEALTVANQNITLPGVGSYIAFMIQHRDLHAVACAIMAMLVVILLYNEVLFKPLLHWSHKFQDSDDVDDRSGRSLIVMLFLRSKWLQFVGQCWRGLGVCLCIGQRYARYGKTVGRSVVFSAIVKTIGYWMTTSFLAAFFLGRRRFGLRLRRLVERIKWLQFVYYLLMLLLAMFVMGGVAYLVAQTVTWQEMLHVCWLGLYTGFKVMVLILLCSLLWVPVGVFIGLRQDRQPGVSR